MLTSFRGARAASAALAALLLICGSSAAHSQTTLPQKILLPGDDGQGRGGFGESVSILGGRALVGSPFLTGYVYVYEQSGGSWPLKQRLITPKWDPERVSGTGWVLAQDDNTFLSSDTEYGIVAYFEKPTASSTYRSTALLNGSGNGGGFGTSLGLSGCFGMIGATSPASFPNPRGAVHLYNRCPSGTWTWVGSLYPPSGSTSDQFGFALALFGTELLVGAPNDSGGAGVVYDYLYNGTKWVYKQKIVQTHAAAGNRFGAGVAFRDGLAVIGSPGRPDAGQAELFKRSSTGKWSSLGDLVPPTADGTWTGFGSKISVTPDRVLVGTTTDIDFNGSLFVYKRTGDTLQLQLQLKANDNTTNTGFATDFSVAGRSLIVGEPRGVALQNTTERGGRAIIYQLPP